MVQHLIVGIYIVSMFFEFEGFFSHYKLTLKQKHSHPLEENTVYEVNL